LKITVYYYILYGIRVFVPVVCFFQRVSLAVQRYNSVAFKGTFTVPTELD